MKYDVVIFDWNGTVIDDVGACLEILNTLLARYDLPSVELGKYREAFGFPVIEYYKRVGFDFNGYTFEDVASKFVPMYDDAYPKCSLYEGVVDLIKDLRKNGVKVILLSATEKGSLKEQTDYFGVSDCFDEIIGTDNFHGKSKTEEAKEFVKREEFAGKKILLVGDTDYDYLVAEEIGVDCALMSYGHKSLKSLKKCTQKVFSDAQELAEFLGK